MGGFRGEGLRAASAPPWVPAKAGTTGGGGVTAEGAEGAEVGTGI